MKTVRVRIAVAVDPNGEWNASGWNSLTDKYDDVAMGIALEGVGEGEARYWIEAELPLPTGAATVQADIVRPA